MFAATKLFCHNKNNFVATSHIFVMTKIILVAVPANHDLCVCVCVCVGGGGSGGGESPACVIRGHLSAPLSTRAARTPSTRPLSAENSAAR